MTIEQINNLQIADFENMSEEQFQAYKDGLIAQETERLRVIALKARIQAIQDPHGVLQAAGCSNHNPPLEFNRIIDENDTVKLEEYEAFNSSLISAKAQQIINEQSRKFLGDTDWKVLRHLRQISLNVQTTLNNQEYLDLEQARQNAANSVVEND